MRREVFDAISNGLKKMNSQSKNPGKFQRQGVQNRILYRDTAMKGSSDIDVILLLNYRQKADTSGPPNAKILLMIQSLVPNGYVAKLNTRSVKISKQNSFKNQR